VYRKNGATAAVAQEEVEAMKQLTARFIITAVVAA
jgi:hypothetical protein